MADCVVVILLSWHKTTTAGLRNNLCKITFYPNWIIIALITITEITIITFRSSTTTTIVVVIIWWKLHSGSNNACRNWIRWDNSKQQPVVVAIIFFPVQIERYRLMIICCGILRRLHHSIHHPTVILWDYTNKRIMLVHLVCLLLLVAAIITTTIAQYYTTVCWIILHRRTIITCGFVRHPIIIQQIKQPIQQQGTAQKEGIAALPVLTETMISYHRSFPFCGKEAVTIHKF